MPIIFRQPRPPRGSINTDSSPSMKSKSNTSRARVKPTGLPFRRLPISRRTKPPRYKRIRSDRPRIRVNCDFVDDTNTRSFSSPSEDRLTGHFSFGDAEFDQPFDGEDFLVLKLPLGHYEKELQSLMPHFLRGVKDELQSWSTNAHYTPVAENRRPIYQHAKGINQQRQALPLKEEHQSDTAFAVNSHHGYSSHLACPYYRKNPDKYQLCLLDCNLRTINDIIRHLHQHHTKPPHCPMCSRRFGTFLARDKHILERTCKIRDFADIDGINEYQKAQLVSRDRPSLDNWERWERIWTIIFPRTEFTGEPYLDTDCEQAISMVRDFWKNEGRKFISRYVESHGLLRCHHEDKKQALASLAQMTRKEFLFSMYEKFQ
ncbi:hypothetical protein B0T10DRAFT_492953 [Thelonectria olida]|uniref:C2H2-type domain-containing protein n=1 Tax=Thelonectria olida TaxID=1576542 RepID=A0A9P9AJ20_9HYPO|nr:hypothetical protein B0T10DRAFT_492953 [Thelonectria olida]